MLLLAVVDKVPESHHNMSIIFNAIGISKILFKLTGDFAFVMPILGCFKGCAATNPCPICDQLKTKEGGMGSRWQDLPK